MHHILIAIKEIIDSNLKLYLPHVASDHLENNGAVYYMNGKDGTEFDWYINEKFPPFMVLSGLGNSLSPNFRSFFMFFFFAFLHIPENIFVKFSKKY